MSDFDNVLDSYRSYSYHHILLVASDTESLRKLTEHSTGSSSFLEVVQKAGLGDEVTTPTGGKAFLLVDTRRFSSFNISTMEMVHAYGTGSLENPSVPAALMKMRLVDTTGLSFFNHLMDTMRDDLKASRGSSFFLLVTLFIGHTDRNTTEIIDGGMLFTPLLLMTMDIEFTSSGSIYDMEFVELEGNPGGGFHVMLELKDVQSVVADKSPTLEGMMQALEDRLNEQSAEFFRKYNNTLLIESGDGKRGSSGRLVQYMITLPEKWRNYPVSTAGRGQSIERVFKALQQRQAELDKAKAESEAAAKKGGSADSTGTRYTSFSATMSITDAIKAVLESSEKILEQANVKSRKDRQVSVYKTIVSVTSDEFTYVVHFDIYEHKAPDVSGVKQKSTVAAKSDAKSNYLRAPDGSIRNMIEYDYIFTGRNRHITDMKIKFSPDSAIAFDGRIDVGTARRGTNVQAGQVSEKKQDVDGEPRTDDLSLLRSNDPVFVNFKTAFAATGGVAHGPGTLSQGTDYKGFQQNRQEFTKTMALLHFLGTMELQLTIRGNPALLKKYADRQVRNGVPQHFVQGIGAELLGSLANASSLQQSRNIFLSNIKSRIQSAKAQYYSQYVKPKASLAAGSLFDVASVPMFIRVNIMAPNVDVTGQPLSDKPMFTDQFFFQGAYMLLTVRHSFENGIFSQDLLAVPYDVYNDFSTAWHKGSSTKN